MAETKTQRFPYLHDDNLRHLRQALRVHRNGVYIHGDGNIYPKEDNRQTSSKDRIDFRNMEQVHPGTDGGGYRCFFEPGDQLPANLKELEKMLLDYTAKEKYKPENNQPNIGYNPLALPALGDEDEEDGANYDPAIKEKLMAEAGLNPDGSPIDTGAAPKPEDTKTDKSKGKTK